MPKSIILQNKLRMVTKYKNIKPLIIGIGVAGKRHLEAQLKLGIQTGVYTTNPQTAKSLRQEKNIIVFDKLEEGIDWSNLVHVCTPDDKHTDFVAMAIKKGKAVLCEKSFTTNLKDALYLQKLARKYKCLIIVGQNYRLTPSFAETRKRIQDGQLGKITHIETTYIHDTKDYQQRYSKQNFLYIGGSHAVDLALWIANEPIVDVTASSKNSLSYKIKIEFVSGVKANLILDANTSRTISGTDLKVTGEKGQLESHNKLDSPLTKLSNKRTLTIPLEVRIIDDYLLGKSKSYWPLPNIEEAVNIIKILDTVENNY